MRFIALQRVERLNSYKMENQLKASIKEDSFLGIPAITAENSSFMMTVVPSLGSRVIRLRSKHADTELLRTPDTIEAYQQSPLLYGIPVLFPPNRIEKGQFSFDGRQYQFHVNEPLLGNHSHGLVHDQSWKLGTCSVEGDRAIVTTEFDSRSVPSVMEQFPHAFTITMRFILEGSTLMQEAKIRNLSDTPFPWGLGYHTTFCFPFQKGADNKDCSMSAPVGRRWVLDDQFLPTGELVEDARSEVLRKGMALEGIRLDDVFLAADCCENEVVMTDHFADLQVVYRADPAFGQWVLHNGDGTGGYMCPEPYTSVTNAFNLPLQRELTGMQVLEAGEACVVRCMIEAKRLQK